MGNKKKPKSKQKPEVNRELDGLDISINSFGQIQASFDIDKINEFLDTHVRDKKLSKSDARKKDKKAGD